MNIISLQNIITNMSNKKVLSFFKYILRYFLTQKFIHTALIEINYCFLNSIFR